MTEAERNALIGRTVQEQRRLKQHLGCLSVRADHMQHAVAQGLPSSKVKPQATPRTAACMSLKARTA